MRWRSIIVVVLLIVTGCNEKDSSTEYIELVNMLDEQNDKVAKLENELEVARDQSDALHKKYILLIDSLSDIRIRQDDLEDQLSQLSIDEDLSRLSSDVEYINNIIRNLSDYTTTNDGYLHISNADSMHFEYDEVEWIDINDSERIEALGLNIDEDFPNGFYLHNAVEEYELVEADLNVRYHILGESGDHITVTYEEFIEEVQRHNPGLFCSLFFIDGNLVEIYETYLI